MVFILRRRERGGGRKHYYISLLPEKEDNFLMKIVEIRSERESEKERGCVCVCGGEGGWVRESTTTTC